MPVKIAYPPPPPTTNALTTQQRALRLRSSKKLERVLGSALQWTNNEVDQDARMPFMFNPHANKQPSHSRSSSTASSKFLSRSSTFPPSRSGGAATASRGVFKPLLRQAFIPSLDSIPGSPITPISGRPSSPPCTTLTYRPASLLSTATSLSESITPSSKRGNRASLLTVSSTFTPNVKSPSAIRREKMERLRRRLGNDVPVGMVFPDTQEDDEDLLEDAEEDMPRPVSAQPPPYTSVPVPSSIPQSRVRSPTSISLTRDSVVVGDGEQSPHRAPRRNHTPRPSIDSILLPIIDEGIDEEESNAELHRIGNWADSLSRGEQTQSQPSESAWFSDVDEEGAADDEDEGSDFYFSDPETLSVTATTISEPSSPISMRTHSLLSSPSPAVHNAEMDSAIPSFNLELEDDIDGRIMFWRRSASSDESVRSSWYWGLPQDVSSEKQISEREMRLNFGDVF